MKRWLTPPVLFPVFLVVLVVGYASRPQPTLTGAQAARAEISGRLEVERRAAASFASWQQKQGMNATVQGELGDKATKVGKEAADIYDGLYAGIATTGAHDHAVSFKVKVTNGIGSGTQSRLDCGTAPMALTISPSGDVSGMVLMFSSTCVKTELTVRGRAIRGTLRLRLGSQYVELSMPVE